MKTKTPKIPKIMLLLEKSRAYSRGLLRGLAKYSRLHGPWAFYDEPPFYMNSTGGKRTLYQMKDWGVDGIIMRDTQKIQQMLAIGLPTIVTDLRKKFSGSPIIKTDDVAIGKMAAEYFLKLGLRQFAFCGFDTMFWSRDRCEGFADSITEAGFTIQFYKRPRSRVKRLPANELILMAEWLKSLPKPVGLMACNDDRGRQVIEACKIAGVHVPEDVAIVGADNDELICELSSPRLSSVALNLERSGFEAAELLDRLMRRREKMTNQQIIVQPTRIVARQSTDILAIEDSEVAEAVRYIRQHAKERIQVDDVARVAGVSRRGLERRFRQVLSCSILSEMRRVRLEQVIRMLVETNHSIGHIALALNFPSIEHISRFFRQHMKISPLAYRKKYGGK
ncbi:MAG: AraC family transcriptional regulator [Planctomycetota bacterium]|jgi:LacI family transcriptional regulator